MLCWRGFFPEHWLPTFTRQGSRLGSHPDRLLVPGVEASTGSLGHGLPLAVGVALALRAKGADQRVVVLTGDAELNEGSNWEAIMLAPQLQLGNLTLLVIDNNSSTIDLVPSTSAWPSSAGTPSRSTAATTPPSRPRSPAATTRLPPSSRP